jgi:putative CocE/NonD family hydrolase
VIQDCRGTHASEGAFVKYLSDGEDGADTCAWLVAQAWSDGRICTVGLSYDAHTQGALGCYDPPGLVAQVLDCGGLWNAWKSGGRAFGVFEMKQVMWAFRQAIGSPESAADPKLKSALEAEDVEASMRRLPWRRGESPLRHHPKYEEYLIDQWEHEVFDGFWQKPPIWMEGKHQRYSKAACVHLSGWYDPYVLSVTRNYQGLKTAGKGPQYLILGAKARAALHGNFMVSSDDLRAVAPAILMHRIITTFAAQSERFSAKQIINRLVAEFEC